MGSIKGSPNNWPGPEPEQFLFYNNDCGCKKRNDAGSLGACIQALGSSPSAAQINACMQGAGGSESNEQILQDQLNQCDQEYPDGLIKGYHKGHNKAYRECVAAAHSSYDSNQQITAKQKLVSTALPGAGTGANAASGTGAADTSGNSTTLIAVFLLIVAVGGAVWYKKKQDAVAPPAA